MTEATATEVKVSEISTTIGKDDDAVTFTMEVGGTLEELVENCGESVVFQKAKAAMAAQAHSALKAQLDKHEGDGEKALEGMTGWKPTIGKSKVDPVLKAFSDVPQEQREAYLEILAGMANNGSE